MNEHKQFALVLNMNKKEVRTKIPPIDFKTARRLAGPIYDVLQKELSEQGCVVSAKHFQCLSHKEMELFERGSIRDRVQDDPELLYEIVDHCMLAEAAFTFRDCGGLQISFNNILQLLTKIADQGVMFEWLLMDIFEIVMKIISQLDPKKPQPLEYIARLYYMYGLRLSHSPHEALENSVKYLRKALELCRGQKWLAEFEARSNKSSCTPDINKDKSSKTLHELIAHSLAEVTVKYARTLGKDYVHAAAEMAKQAMILVAEVGINTNKYEFYNAFITYAEYLTFNNKFNDAMKLLSKFDLYFNKDEIKQYKRLYCRQYMIRGTCYASVNNIAMAKADQNKAIAIARQSAFRDLEAHCLVNLGLLYSLNKLEYTNGKMHYEKARRIFIELNDRKNETKTHYLLAKLRANEMFPFFCDVLKYTDITYCNIYKLRRWKYACEPFWISWSEYLSKVSEDPLCCLLEKEDPARMKVNLQASFAKQQTFYNNYSEMLDTETYDTKSRGSSLQMRSSTGRKRSTKGSLRYSARSLKTKPKSSIRLSILTQEFEEKQKKEQQQQHQQQQQFLEQKTIEERPEQ